MLTRIDVDGRAYSILNFASGASLGHIFGVKIVIDFDHFSSDFRTSMYVCQALKFNFDCFFRNCVESEASYIGLKLKCKCVLQNYQKISIFC